MVIVLAAVAVVSGVRGHSVAGLAASVPVPGPPQPGDCVTSPPPPGGLGDLSAGKYLQLDLRRCAGSRYGEVVAVIANPAAPVQTRQGSETFSTNANSDVCYGATLAFVGVAAKAAIPMPLFTYWSTTVATSIAASTPNPRQRSAGQHWLACVTYLPATGSPQESTVRPYTNSLRNAVATGNQRNYLGLCSQSTDWSAGLSPGVCALAHRSEMLGAGQLGNAPTTRADLLHTCSQFLEHPHRAEHHRHRRSRRFALHHKCGQRTDHYRNRPGAGVPGLRRCRRRRPPARREPAGAGEPAHPVGMNTEL